MTHFYCRTAFSSPGELSRLNMAKDIKMKKKVNVLPFTLFVIAISVNKSEYSVHAEDA